MAGGRPRRVRGRGRTRASAPRDAGAGEGSAQGRTRRLRAQGRPLVAARRQAGAAGAEPDAGTWEAFAERRGGMTGPTVNLSRPRGRWAPDLFLSPGPCHRGPLQSS